MNDVSRLWGVTLLTVAVSGWCLAGDVVAWRGADLGAWSNRPHDCRDVAVVDGVLKGTVVGRDPQFYASLEKPIAPKGTHVVYLRLRTSRGGMGQVFWATEAEPKVSEARQKRFPTAADGEWHDYRIRPGWGGASAIRGLRLDLPPELEGGTPFEIAEIRIAEEGLDVDVDTAKKIGVRFSLQMPEGLHYCTLTWSGDSEIPGEFGFTPATDGRRHEYWFDLRSATVRRWGPSRGKKSWTGRLNGFFAEQTSLNRELPAENLVFIDRKPDTPADPVVTSARAGEAIPRAGRPFPLEIVVRNFGTVPAEGLEFALDSLPAGVKVLHPSDLHVTGALPGADGTETIGADCRPQLVNERVCRVWLDDLGVGKHRFGLTMKAIGVSPRRIEVETDVLPSLGLPRAEGYPSEPRKVDTAPYEIGAFLFPGWTSHRWHAVWSHAPWRKPVLGWYDEERPETIDWQIKHMVENGISFVFVDWYWSRGRQHLNHWMTAFREAKFRKCLKWSVMWANHNGPGSHSVEDQEKVTRFWVENYFADPQYQRIDGMPVVTIWSPEGMERDLAGKGGCKALLEVSQRVAREAGYKGVYFIAVRGPDREDRPFLKTFADRGFRRTCVYKYVGGIAGAPAGEAGSRPYKWLADTSLGHWRALRRNSTVPFLPSLSTAWDDRPWRGEIGWEITGINAKDFKRICADAKRFSDETGERMLLLGPLDEWGEGSIGYPNAELGFGMFEAVRDTFGHRPAGGWPVNHAPEDVGLVCPQR